jgi:hypothetical protein
MVFRPLIVVSLWSLALLPLAGATTPSDKLNGLLSNSPFGASRTNATGSNAAEPLEFRAVLEENGSKFFSIYETVTRRSIWVELNDAVNGFSVKSYDAERFGVTVEYQGRPLTLTLKRAPAVAQALQPGPMGPGALPNAAVNQVVAGAPLDQQRLQQIQEEIRRRRALRQPTPVPAGQPGSGPTPGAPGTTSGPQLTPSNLPGPQFVPSNQPGPQPIPGTQTATPIKP